MTALGSFNVGDILTAADMNSISVFTAQTAYTPTISQGVTTNITKTVTVSTYDQINKLVIYTAVLEVTGTGTSGSNITVTLPVAAQAYGTALTCIGHGYIYDASATTTYTCSVLRSGDTVVFRNDASGANRVGTTPAFALASGDVISFTVTYEAD